MAAVVLFNHGLFSGQNFKFNRRAESLSASYLLAASAIQRATVGIVPVKLVPPWFRRVK